MNRFAVLFFVGCLLQACSSKSNDLKTAKSNGTNETPTRFYYTDLQILTETTPEGECPEDKKISEDVHLAPKASLDDKNEILLAAGSDFKYFVANVSFEMIGFDSAKYGFTVLDGIMPRQAPFHMRLRRTPGQILELHFLDQVVPMKLLTTPVYTFSATEKRGDCTIKHNVNVFAEKIGYFKRSDVQPEKP